MGLFDWDDDYQQYRRLMNEAADRDQQAAAQAQALAQQAAAQQSQAIFSNNGSTSGQINIFTDPWGSSSMSNYTFSTPKPRSHVEAENFCYGLNNLDPGYIQEIIVKEPIYMKIVSYMGYDSKEHPDIIKSLHYSTFYGTILLKNEKYQFDLDKYIEDGPAVEMVEE